MKQRRFLTGTLAVAALLLTAFTFTSCRGRGHGDERIDRFAERIADKLDFTDEQKALLNDIVKTAKEDRAESRKQREEFLPEAQQLFMASELDKARVKQIIQDRQAQMNSKVDKYLDKVAALHKTLTPEQKKEVMETFNKFKDHWR